MRFWLCSWLLAESNFRESLHFTVFTPLLSPRLIGFCMFVDIDILPDLLSCALNYASSFLSQIFFCALFASMSSQQIPVAGRSLMPLAVSAALTAKSSRLLIRMDFFDLNLSLKCQMQVLPEKFPMPGRFPRRRQSHRGSKAGRPHWSTQPQPQTERIFLGLLSKW